MTTRHSWPDIKKKNHLQKKSNRKYLFGIHSFIHSFIWIRKTIEFFWQLDEKIVFYFFKKLIIGF